MVYVGVLRSYFLLEKCDQKLQKRDLKLDTSQTYYDVMSSNS